LPDRQQRRHYVSEKLLNTLVTNSG